jgi:tetratricopeptide (TPR) repeat protein
MQVASVIGREFAFRILQAILETREELRSHLINLQGLEFIYEKKLFPELEYIFKHALTQEVAYSGLLLKKRKEIHNKIGMAIEELYPARLEEFYEMLAYHYSKGDNLDKACYFMKLSGNKSIRNYSLWEAYRFYEETLKILRRMPETERNKKEQIEVILLMAVPLRLLGYPEDSIKFLEQGERICKELGDGRSTARLYTYVGVFYSAKGNPALGRKYLEDSLAEAEKVQEIEIMAPVSYGLCFSYMLEGSYRNLINIASRAIDLLEKTQREYEYFGAPMNLYTYMHAYIGFSLGALGEFAQGEESCEKAVSFANKIDHLFSIGIAKYLYGGLYIYKGDGVNAIKYSQACIQDLEKSQGVIFLPTAWSFLGYGYYIVGEFNKALNFIEKGLKMQLGTGLPFGLSLHYLFSSRVLCDLGNLSEAKASAEQALKLAQTNNQKFLEGMSGVQLGRVIGKMEGRQFHMAEEYMVNGLKILDELGMKPDHSSGTFFIGELYADAGQKEKGLDNLKKAESMFQEMGMDYWLARTRKLLESLEA